jgi:hypothetical protein
MRHRLPEIAADARRRADRLYAFDILAVCAAVESLDDARPAAEAALADRPALLTAARTLWSGVRDRDALTAGLDPAAALVIDRALAVLADPDRVAPLLPSPFDDWIGTGPMPAGDELTATLDRLPEPARRVALAGIGYLDNLHARRQEWAQKIAPYADAVVLVALARATGQPVESFIADGEPPDWDEASLLAIFDELEPAGGAALRRLWQGEWDEDTLHAAVDSPFFHLLIHQALVTLLDVTKGR